MAGSSQWSSPVESVASFSDHGPPDRVPRHSINTREAYETESHSTNSSGARKDLSPYSISDHGGHYLDKSLQIGYMPRTSSSVSAEEHISESIEAADVLEAVHHHPHHHRRHNMRPHNFPFQFSQESEYNGHFASTSSTSLPLSQSTGHSGYHRGYRNGPYKPSSPGSSSDNASLTSSIQHRLGSGPASEASFSSINLSQSTTSSRSGYVYRLPRPSLPGSNPGSATNLIPSRHYQSIPQGDLPTSNDKAIPYYHHPMPKKGFHSPDEYESHSHHSPDKRTSTGPQKRGDMREKKHSEGKSERDSFTMKIDMVMSMMSALSSSSSQSDADGVKLLLALSQSSETLSVLRHSMCMNVLIKFIHNYEETTPEQAEIKTKALQALHNIIESNPAAKQRRCERSVFATLNKVRSHCDKLFAFIHNIKHQKSIATTELEDIHASCNALMVVLRKIFKFSSDKELHRPAILSLGGLHTMADILISDYQLPKNKDQKKIIGHNSETIAITITILINLTYGDINNKIILCNIPNFLNALMYHLYSLDEQIMSKGAQVLRNLSCKATPEIKECLNKCNAAVALMEAVDGANSEPTIQHITSALWNISAHSIDNRHKVCRTKNGIETLVGLLSYNSPSGATVIIENVGGVLRNLSNVISQEEGYRRRFREAGGLAKLVQHLKSRNRVVLANATGILWNLSARCPENQKLLWDLGCIPLLDVLQSTKQKNTSENARGALRNLLAFGQSKGWTSKVDLPTPPSAVRSRHPHSRSTTTLISGGSLNQVNGHNQSGRNSAPFVSAKASAMHNSTNSLIQIRSHSDHIPYIEKSSLRSSMNKVSPKTTHSHGFLPHDQLDDYCNRDNHYNQYSSNSTPKFSRVASAPQANDEREEEWMNYRPGAKQGNSPEMVDKYQSYHPHPIPSSRKPKISSGHHHIKMSNGHSYPYSQTGSCDSEFQSISGPSLGQSPTEILEGGVPANREVAYDELEIELDDEETLNTSHYRHPSEADSETSEHLSIADQFARDRESKRRMTYNPPPSSNSPSKLSPSLSQHKANAFISDLARTLGTSGLALDGTAPNQDALEPISESNVASSPNSRSDSSRSHANSISSEMNSDI